MKSRQQITEEYVAALKRNDLPPCYRAWYAKPWFTAENAAQDSYFKPVELIPYVESLIVETDARIENRKWHGFYDVGEDVVCMPDRYRFYSTGHFYEKCFQLLAYWSERRVGFLEQHENRDRGFWDVAADLASSFMCNELQIPKGHAN